MKLTPQQVKTLASKTMGNGQLFYGLRAFAQVGEVTNIEVRPSVDGCSAPATVTPCLTCGHITVNSLFTCHK